MTIKLVRIDAADACKIQLPLGEHIFGRGKLLNCDDKRISRQHGKLNVDNNLLTITALHQNPCFFTRKGETFKDILKQNNTVTLSNGDKLGLLPDTFWYEVIYSNNDDSPSAVESDKNTEEYSVGSNESDKTTSVETNPTKSIVSDDGFDNELSELQLLIATEESLQVPSKDNLTNLNQNTSEQINEPNEVDTDVNSEPNEHDAAKDENALNSQNELNDQDKLNVQNVKHEPDVESNTGEQNNSIKRSHSPDNNDVKKIKTEPVDREAQNSEDAKPGPSLNQAASDSSKPPNPPPRERCMYGANCYRKNPVHLAQFSHPRDSDWGPGERGVCPYAAACAKADPRHWRDHDHPPGTLPPPPPAGPKKMRRKRASSGSSDSPELDLIVTGKRARRSVARTTAADDSDEQTDPYGTDESDEWQPDSTQSQDYSEDF